MNKADKVLENKGQQTCQEITLLYEHFFNYVQTESSAKIVERFGWLLNEYEKYPNSNIQTVLETMNDSSITQKDCYYFLNRCCQLFISYWSIQSENKAAIFNLLALFKNLQLSEKSSYKLSKTWQQSIKKFPETPQYIKLQRLARILNPRLASDAPKPEYLGDLLGRYPFLYKHCLLDNDNIKEYRRLLSRLKLQQQKAFEQGLTKSVIDHKQKLQIERIRQLSGQSSQLFSIVKNPTLLSGKAFRIALEYFTEICQKKTITLFSNEGESLQFREFKIWLENYLVQDVGEQSGQRPLKQHLTAKIPLLFSNCDEQPLNEFLILRTCTQLLNELGVDPNQKANHLTFINLTNCLGATQMASLLLKLVLLAPKLQSSLRQRLARLFEYYESTSIEQSLWLIYVLENFLLAFTMWEEKGNLLTQSNPD
ncbi:hypothetical protein VB715_18995 [Crocosphaera sp. UHCC 0190]|uniref:hypothetical protein n=1 Tax=Crocosphaera sp. UHCC 0190 TaxID=3110246 RepID=UPI002B1F865C|nr:hypothetical protein [Crocosphaera sp. UHCC 0190]MEA5511863.1 hypothetical protein [Crocosphaera sp. UHCC 0190]